MSWSASSPETNALQRRRPALNDPTMALAAHSTYRPDTRPLLARIERHLDVAVTSWYQCSLSTVLPRERKDVESLVSDGNKSDYDLIGGASAVTAVVDAFYQRVLADPELSHFFTDVDIPRLKRHQVMLVSHVLGGPVTYDGRSLADAHEHLPIEPEHFRRVVEHLVDALDKAGVPSDVIGRVGTALQGSEPEIVGTNPA